MANLFLNKQGTGKWIENGELHRENGPAVMYPDGSCSWYLRNERYSFEEYCEKLNISEAGQQELRKWYR